ncbi:ribokinase [Fulvimarina endophytica]|uniref:Ribokinase n=1 Tax=Fulvimarina endophytica TaxID=2293836 RepID=A0A371XAB3_9HYPH|nr:ribokinase [Fulvimarina endophytica]RFC66178.1 ribokinase [Fulvimarina endophytica]
MNRANTGIGEVVVFGSLNLDLVCRVETIAHPGETVLAPRYVQMFGGKGANQAVAAARILGSGGSVRMIGAVGEDAFGASVVANLAAMGVDVSGIQHTPEPTGAAFISIDARGENAITVASGANALLGPDALHTQTFSEDTVLVLQMETPAAAGIEAARRVKAAGGSTILNLAPVPPALSAEQLRELTHSIDWLVVNEIELSAAASALGLASASIPERSADLGRHLDIDVVATLGASGVVAARRDGTLVSQPAFPVAIEDTTGAGDTFCGTFAAGLAEGLDPASAIRRATCAASLACRRVGAQSAMPHREVVEAVLAQNG